MDKNYLKIKKQLKSLPHRFTQTSGDAMVVRFEKNNLKEVTSKQSTNFQLEVINAGKIGTASTTAVEPGDLVPKALASSNFGDKVSYELPKPKPLNKVKLYSKKVTDLKPQDFIKLGNELIAAIILADKDILVDVRLSKSVGDSGLFTSSGFKDQAKETSITVMAEGELVTQGDILTIGDYWNWKDFNFESQKFAKAIADKFRLAKKMVQIPSGKYTVVLVPEVLANLVEFYETALSAQSVFKKTSKWVDKMDQQVADPRVTLIDDPMVDFAAASTNSDDEGIPAKPLTLIEKGVLKNFYTDLKYAEKLKIEPNGRGFGIPTTPSTTNLVLSPGEKTLKQIIKEIDNGILVEQVIGGGQDSPYSGDMSFNIHLGFLIKNGEVVGRIKDCLMSGNAFEMMKDHLSEISADRVWYGGSFHTPYMSFNNITVASKT